jgi:hypothetical protein
MRWVYLTVIILFVVAIVLFSIQNVQSVTLSFVGFSIRTPLAILTAVVRCPKSGHLADNHSSVADQRFWYGWKMWSFAFTATWHACPQSEGLGSAVNLSDAAS